MTARILVRPRAALHRARVGPVSPEYTNPRVPSWITKPTVGTVCVTATGVTHRSPTRCSASSTSVRYLTTGVRSEEHTSELQSPCNLVCRLLLEKKKKTETNCTQIRI